MVRSEMNIQTLFTKYPEILKSTEITELLRISRATLTRMNKKVRVMRVGREDRYLKTEVVKYLQGFN